jgi:sulfoxide reductase heme-binding subunit YedZ
VTHDPTFWIIARSAGLVAYALLTMSVLAGLVLKARPFGKALRPAAVTDVHRFLALLGLGALAVHGTSLVLDRTVDISPLALVLPGLIPYRPLWTSLGVVAAELMILVYASFSQRKRIGVKTWRTLHWLTYAIFALATVHGITAGTDTSRPWALPLYGGAVGAVLAATAWRALVPPQSARAREAGRLRPASPPRPAEVVPDQGQALADASMFRDTTSRVSPSSFVGLNSTTSEPA